MDSIECSCSLNILSSQPRWEGLCSYSPLPSLAARSFTPVGPFQIQHETCGLRQVENRWPCSSGRSHSCNPESRNTFAGPGSCLPCLCETGCVCSCLVLQLVRRSLCFVKQPSEELCWNVSWVLSKLWMMAHRCSVILQALCCFSERGSSCQEILRQSRSLGFRGALSVDIIWSNLLNLCFI